MLTCQQTLEELAVARDEARARASSDTGIRPEPARAPASCDPSRIGARRASRASATRNTVSSHPIDTRTLFVG